MCIRIGIRYYEQVHDGGAYEAGALRVTAAPSVGNSISTDLSEWVSNKSYRIRGREREGNRRRQVESFTCSAAIVLIGLHL